jgi:hypothetical protein
VRKKYVLEEGHGCIGGLYIVAAENTVVRKKYVWEEGHGCIELMVAARNMVVFCDEGLWL